MERISIGVMSPLDLEPESDEGPTEFKLKLEPQDPARLESQRSNEAANHSYLCRAWSEW